MAYAVVKFTDEDKTRIVSCEDIKNFNVKNLNVKKKYLVKFVDGGYYPAQILTVKDSVEELESMQAIKRLPCLNKALLESASEDSDIDTYNIKKQPIRKLSKLMSNLYLELFKKFEEEESGFLKSYKEQQEKSKQAVSKKNEEFEELTKLKQTNKEFQSKVADLTLQNKDLSVLNIQLQKTVIDYFENFEKIHTKIDKVSTEKTVNTDIGQNKNHQVHLGRNVYLPEVIFNDIWFRSTSGPQFIKNISAALFGTEALLLSSVTGKQSNRVKKDVVKPALDGTKQAAIEDIYRYYLERKDSKKDIEKEIKSIGSYIRSKISDLARTSRRQQDRKEESNDTADASKMVKELVKGEDLAEKELEEKELEEVCIEQAKDGAEADDWDRGQD